MSADTSDFEYAFYIGNYLSGILYGLELSIYGAILHRIFKKGNRSSPKSRRFCIIYSTVMIMLSTINISGNAIFGQNMWITHRDDPGGVSNFLATQITVWYNTLASTSVICCIFMGDGLLLYRLFLIYGRSYVVLIFPALAYLAAVGLAIVQVVLSGLPNGNFFGGMAAKVAIAFYVITVCLNIVLTSLICGRLLRASKQVASSLGKESAKVYTSAVAILVESSALYSVFGIMYLVPYALGVPIADLFGQLWTKTSVIAPLLIILRVVKGRAWTAHITATSRTSLAFATQSADVGSTTLADGRLQFGMERISKISTSTA